TVTLTNDTLSGNSATDGGGIYNYGTVTLTNDTLSGNSATDGGGIYNDGTVTLTNVTISGNSATYGGGIYNDYTGTVPLTTDTLSGNSANYGGGNISTCGTVTLTNTIVANSPTGGDVFNTGTLTGSHNLIDDGTDGLADTIVADPELGPLQDNGGPTQTMALMAGSPALDAASAALSGAPTTDQRGALR